MKTEFSARACSVLYNILKANNVKGHVLIPSNICESVPATYLLLGIQPIFCDISLNDYQIDKGRAFDLLRSLSINVLHYNHTYGYISKEDGFFLEQVKKKYPDILVVDDRCLCFPEFDLTDDKVADVTLYSTGSVKCVDIGWGGYAIIKDNLEYLDYQIEYSSLDLAEFDKHVKECHRERKPINEKVLLSHWLEISKTFQGNYFDVVRRKSVESYEQKKLINSYYAHIPGALPVEYCNWRYQLLLENAKECIEAIFKAGLFCSFHYKSLGNGYFDNIQTPNNDYLEDHIVNLFNDFRFMPDQAIKVTEILQKIAIPAIK